MLRYFKLNTSISLEVTGKDATRYLHNRLSNDVRAMRERSVLYAACLSPQGRAQALFTVIRTDAEGYRLFCDGGDRESVVAGLKRFIVADRVSVVDLSNELRIVHFFSASQQELNGLFKIIGGAPRDSDSFGVGDYGVVSFRRRTDSPGVDIVANDIQLEGLFTSLGDCTEIPPSERDYLRAQGGWPEFPTEFSENTLFSESGLIPVAASFKKGCYVGQEVLEKVEAYGSLPRTLLRGVGMAQSDFAVGADVNVELPGGESERSGKIVSYGYSTDRSKVACFFLLKLGELSIPDQVKVGQTIVQVRKIL